MTDQSSPHALAHAILTRVRCYILPGHHNDFMRDLQALLEEREPKDGTNKDDSSMDWAVNDAHVAIYTALCRAEAEHGAAGVQGVAMSLVQQCVAPRLRGRKQRQEDQDDEG